MPKLGTFVKEERYITGPLSEAAYHGNMGFEEMVRFYREANPKDIDEMEEVVRRGDWEGFRKIVKRVLDVNLK